MSAQIMVTLTLIDEDTSAPLQDIRPRLFLAPADAKAIADALTALNLAFSLAHDLNAAATKANAL